MNSQPTSSTKKKPPIYTNDSLLESLRDLGTGVGKTVVKDVAGKIAGNALQSFLGPIPKSGELTPNKPLNLALERPAAPNRGGERAPLYRRPEFVRPPLVRREETNLKQQIETVRTELKALALSVKKLHQEVQSAIDEVPTDPGIYHLNFLDRLRSVLKILRQEIEESGTWLALWSSRKKKKGFWGMYKKHGTKFGLSSERTSATQAG